MSQPSPAPERPVLNGLVALVAVAVGVGLVLGLVALLGTRVLGVGGEGDGGDTAATTRESMYLPTPAETEVASGPAITLATEDPDAVEDESSEEPEETEPTESESPADGEITLQASATTVSAGERIYFSGVYPGGEGAILWVQRFQDGGWVDFPASVGVTNGTFSSYVFTGQGGLNRFRVIDRDTQVASNEIRVTVG